MDQITKGFESALKTAIEADKKANAWRMAAVIMSGICVILAAAFALIGKNHG